MVLSSLFFLNRQPIKQQQIMFCLKILYTYLVLTIVCEFNVREIDYN